MLATETSPVPGTVCEVTADGTFLFLCWVVALILITFLYGSGFLVASDRKPDGIVLSPKWN